MASPSVTPEADRSQRLWVVVCMEDPMPDGYVYVPDHHPGITTECQDLTIATNRVFCIVLTYMDAHTLGPRRGIRVPHDVAEQVMRPPPAPLVDDNDKVKEEPSESDAEESLDETSDNDSSTIGSGNEDRFVEEYGHPPEWYEHVEHPQQHPPEWYQYQGPPSFEWGDDNNNRPVAEHGHPPEWYQIRGPSSFEWN